MFAKRHKRQMKDGYLDSSKLALLSQACIKREGYEEETWYESCRSCRRQLSLEVSRVPSIQFRVMSLLSLLVPAAVFPTKYISFESARAART